MYLLLMKIKESQNWLRLDGSSGEPLAHPPAQSGLLMPVSRMGLGICEDGHSTVSLNILFRSSAILKEKGWGFLLCLDSRGR